MNVNELRMVDMMSKEELEQRSIELMLLIKGYKTSEKEAKKELDSVLDQLEILSREG